MPRQKRSYQIRLIAKNKYIAGTIHLREVLEKLRRPLPPPVQVHKNKKAYSRKRKHQT